MSGEAIGTREQFFVAADKVTKGLPLTAYEFRILDSTHPDLAARARKAAERETKQAAEAQRRAATKPAPTKPAARTATDLILDGTFTEAWKAAIRGDGSAWADLVAKHAYLPVTLGALDLLVAQATFLHHQEVRRLTTELAAVQQRLAEVEQRPVGLKYCGTWQTGHRYTTHDGVTHHGSVWVCKADRVESEPGQDPARWQLAAKRGADGRDGKDLR